MPCSKAGAAEARTAQSRKHALLAQDTEPRGWTRTVLLPRGTSKPDRDREPESGLKNKPNRLSPLYAQIPQRDNHPGHVKGSMVLTRTARKPELGSSITANRPVTIDLPPLEFSGPRPPVRKLMGSITIKFLPSPECQNPLLISSASTCRYRDGKSSIFL